MALFKIFSRGGFLKIVSVGVPTYAGMKTGFLDIACWRVSSYIDLRTTCASTGVRDYYLKTSLRPSIFQPVPMDNCTISPPSIPASCLTWRTSATTWWPPGGWRRASGGRRRPSGGCWRRRGGTEGPIATTGRTGGSPRTPRWGRGDSSIPLSIGKDGPILGCRYAHRFIIFGMGVRVTVLFFFRFNPLMPKGYFCTSI